MGARYRRADDRRHRCHLRAGRARRSERGPGRRRPVGAVVRPLPHPRARSSRRSSTPPSGPWSSSRSTWTRTRRICHDLPGAVDPGRVRPEGPAGRRRVHRGAPRGPGDRVRRAARPRRRPRPTCWWRRATRRRCAGPSSSSPTTPAPWSALARLLVDARRARRGAPAPGPDPRDRRAPPAGGGGPLGRSSRSRCPPTDVDVTARRPARAVKDDEDARQEFLDLLETLGPDDPRTASYRKALASPPVLKRSGPEVDTAPASRAGPRGASVATTSDLPGRWSWASSTGRRTPSTTRARPSPSTRFLRAGRRRWWPRAPTSSTWAG